MRHILDRTRAERARFALVTVGLGVGVWQGSNLLAVALGIVGYLVSATVAHPRDALDYWRARPAYRRYLGAVRAGYGELVDLGSGDDQTRLALAGAITPFRVFISSTFLDLRSERDRLAKDLFPRLGRECERRGAVWAPIDLRWGITELQRNAGEVAQICLRSVERSRPNTIGIVGSRYGSRAPLSDVDRATLPAHLAEVPDPSLTHLELRHAAEPDPGTVSVFVMDVPRAGPDGERVDAMVDELRRAGAAVVAPVPDADRLVELVESDLMRRLDAQVPDADLANRVLREVSAHRLHEERLAARPRLHAQVPSEVDELLSSRRVAVLQGEAGCGRSTLVAAWASDRRRTHPDDVVICRFVELTESSQTWPQLLRSICAEIALRTGRPIRLPQDDLEVAMAAMRLLADVQSEHLVVVCLDGLDHLRTPSGAVDDFGRGLGWIPQAGETGLAWVPILVSDDTDRETERAYPAGTVDVPPLSYRDRLALAHLGLSRVDRELPAGDVARIAEHPCSEDPAFLGLLLDELHTVSRHEDLAGALEGLLASTSIDELVGRCLDRVGADLDPPRTAQLAPLLAVLARSPLGLTGGELLGLVGAIRPELQQSDLVLLRERLAVLIDESDGTFRVTPCLRRGVRQYVADDDLAELVDRAWLDFFSDSARRFDSRSVSLLTELDTPDVLRELCAIASDPRGLAVLRTTFAQRCPHVLAIVAQAADVRVPDLVRGAAALATRMDDDLDYGCRLHVAEACLDYRLIDEAEHLAGTIPWGEVQHDARLSNRVLAARARASLRGGTPMSLAEWQHMLDHGMTTRSSNVHLAMSGIGVLLARRGDLSWSAKYFSWAMEVAFACGNPAGLAASSSNASLAAVTDSDPGLLRKLGPPLRKTFDSAVQLSNGAGDTETLMASLLRRSVMDLHLGRPVDAAEGLRQLVEVAAPLDHQHYLRLADLGLAVATAGAGTPGAGHAHATRAGVSLAEAADILERELRRVIV